MNYREVKKCIQDHITSIQIQVCLIPHFLFPLTQFYIYGCLKSSLQPQRLCAITHCHFPLTLTFASQRKTHSLGTNLGHLKGRSLPCSFITLKQSLYSF